MSFKLYLSRKTRGATGVKQLGMREWAWEKEQVGRDSSYIRKDLLRCSKRWFSHSSSSPWDIISLWIQWYSVLCMQHNDKVGCISYSSIHICIMTRHRAIHHAMQQKKWISLWLLPVTKLITKGELKFSKYSLDTANTYLIQVVINMGSTIPGMIPAQ